jgi:hypothetical protein
MQSIANKNGTYLNPLCSLILFMLADMRFEINDSWNDNLQRSMWKIVNHEL